MAIKYNPYNWEIRPDIKRIQKELDSTYQDIVDEVVTINRLINSGPWKQEIHNNLDKIEHHQSILYDHIHKAKLLRMGLENSK